MPIICDHELNHDAPSVLVFEQGSEARRQELRQHGKVTNPGVDGGGLLLRVLVDRRAFGDEGVHIGDPHKNFGGAVGKSLGHLNLIKVPRGVVINR